MKKIIFMFLVLSGCAGLITDNITPEPTGNPKLDVYIQKWLEGVNATICRRIVDKEAYLDGFFCVEAIADNEYYIPVSEWRANNLGSLFVLYSKADLRKKMDSDNSFKDYLCLDVATCEQGDLKSMEELQEYRQ